jgi:delta24(24(1))-sterol reductase
VADDESTPEPERNFAESLHSTNGDVKFENDTNGHVNGNGTTNGHSNGHANGHSNGHSKQDKVDVDFKFEADKFFAPEDSSGLHEFGGAIGMSAMMICFPALMYYMWIGAAFYDGKFPTRTEGQSWQDFFGHMWYLVKTEAYPSNKAWQRYWFFGAASLGRKAAGLLLFGHVVILLYCRDYARTAL